MRNDCPPGLTRWLVWSAYALLVTVALVTPFPVRAARTALPDPGARFGAGKSLHLFAYAGLAVLSGWLRVSPARRWLLLVFLSAHACGSEAVQLLIPDRSGTWQDVMINHTGLYAGVLLSWRWWAGWASRD